MAAKVDRDESGFLGGEVAVVVAVVVPVVVVALRAWQREWTEINQVSLGRGRWRWWRWWWWRCARDSDSGPR